MSELAISITQDSAVNVLQSLALISTFGLFSKYIDGPRLRQLVTWFNSFLREQASAGNLSIDVGALRAAAASSSIQSIHKYQYIIDIDPEALASMQYLRKHLGPEVDSLLLKCETYTRLSIWKGTSIFTNHEAVVEFFKQTLRACATERSARALYILDILCVPGLAVGFGFCFKFMFETCQDVRPGRRRFRRSATNLAKKCLEDGIAIETVWDTWKDGDLLIWNIIRPQSNDTTQQIKTLLLSVFTKQKLLFDYLLCMTHSSMVELCNRNPSASMMLRGPTGKLPTKRAHKLAFACKWISPLLLDLAGVDANTISRHMPVDNLVIPKQISSLPLDIEI